MTNANAVNDPKFADSILETVVAWPGITTRLTPRGSTAIVFGDEELGHVHLDRATLDMPVGLERRARIVQQGRAREWVSDWISKSIESDADVTDGLALLRESYTDRSVAPSQ